MGLPMSDMRQREVAVNAAHSCIVQAPAGSGKTELLIQRLLVLLARVERPQQVLAITFTNKAAAEMRERVLVALNSARGNTAPSEPHKFRTWELARGVYERHGESLLRNPGQLIIQTIDSLNAALVRRMPWTSRFGQVPEVTSDPEVLYQQAVEKLLMGFDVHSDDSTPLKVLLRHLDNQVADLERMLINMLRHRDQWLGVVMQATEQIHTDLEETVKGLCRGALDSLVASFPAALADELLFCANFSASNLPESMLQLQALPGKETADFEPWLALSDLLLTAKGELRKTVNKKNGFPSGSDAQFEKERMLRLLADLEDFPDFIRQLGAIRRLPRSGYSHQQWLVLSSLLELLPRLVAELWLVFRAQGQVDFIEIALKAIQSLGEAENPSQLLLNIDHDLRHILVDEFQDTSRLQYRLLDHLISGWTKNDGRTFFLVGDPMQSIYRFREAEVGLFLQSFKGHFGKQQHPLIPLKLEENFRSQKGIVDWINGCFKEVFPATADELSGAVPLSPAEGVKDFLSGDACRIYPYVERHDQAEAQQVVDIIKQARKEDQHQTVAVLVRSRNHLSEILPLLREHNIPYQAQDIDILGAKPAALDIVHLTRALLHQADRLSWMAVLRAPWCGLTLDDLHILLADWADKTVPWILNNADAIERLSPDGRKRIDRIRPALKRAMDSRGRFSLRFLVEGTWLALGAPTCYSVENHADALRVFDLLEEVDEGGDILQFERLNRGLMNLFAVSDSDSDGTLQIMTIHKAKGLEFDTVIIPGLGKMPRNQDSPLLRWFDHPEVGLLMAPVTEKGNPEKDPLYQWIADLESEKNKHETSRLLYVATTRAIRRIHLLGHAKEDNQGRLKPQRGSLLEKLWPLVADDFRQRGVHLEKLEKQQLVSSQKRLSIQWEMPVLSSLDCRVSKAAELPSEKSTHETDDSVFSGWEDPLYRHLGTLVHQQLEKVAKLGFECWHGDKKAERIKEIDRFLISVGVRLQALDSLRAKVCQAVETCISSRRGRWILQPHESHACELPVTGVVEGRIIHAVVDRTFITGGIRWVVDYKSSHPQEDENPDVFFKRELEQYRKQLDIYVQLLGQFDEKVPVRAALYFPFFDGWCEL